jgi:multiple sugar transport system permease protein
MVKAYYIFLFRQTFFSIPRDFEEAARVDGAGIMRTLWSVYLPMLKPTITVMIIFQTVLVWNDYLWPLLCVSRNEAIWTIALGVQRSLAMVQQFKGYLPAIGGTDYPFAFATATVATAPIIVLFLWLQRYFVEGVQGFAIKG